MQLVKLGDVCSLINGDRGKNYPSKSKQTSQGVPFINAGHLTNDGLDMANMNYISLKTFNQLGGGKVDSNDILFCLRGSLGKFASVGELDQGAVASSLVIVRPDTARLLPDFLLLYFASEHSRRMIQKFENGTAQPNLSAKSLKDFVISLPAIDEQRTIVTKIKSAFDKIDLAIELSKREQLYIQEFYNSKLESIFLDQNEAEMVLIDDVCTIKGGKRLPKGSSLANTKTLWPYVRVSDFDHKGGVDLNKIQYLDEDVQKQIERYIITDDDVFLSIAGSIGITGIVPAELNGANLTENACRLIPNQKIDKEYLYYFTLTKSFIEQAAGATRQTAQPKLALIRIKNIHLRLPSLNTQRFSVVNLRNLSSSVESLKLYTDKKINYLQDLKQSMLNEALSESAVK